MEMKNKNILIIGASGGIGESLVKLLKDDNNLILTGRKFTNDFSDLKLLTHHLDISNKESIYTLSEKILKLDIKLDGIIFNAGINHFRKIENTLVDDIQEIINVNLIGCILTNKILLKNLKPESFICNISSALGDIGMPGYSVYGASKAGIKLFSQSLRRELSDTNIKVTYFQPRSVLTNMNSHDIVQMNNELGNTTDLPDLVAQKIIKSIIKDKSGIFSQPEKFFSIINHIFPKIVDNDFRKKLHIINKFLKNGFKI